MVVVAVVVVVPTALPVNVVHVEHHVQHPTHQYLDSGGQQGFPSTSQLCVQ